LICKKSFPRVKNSYGCYLIFASFKLLTNLPMHGKCCSF
jgi:hypothetical protein